MRISDWSSDVCSSDLIDVIRRFMPTPIEGAELESAVRAMIEEIGAADLKDMGRTMAALKERYPGRIDFTKASGIVRASLVCGDRRRPFRRLRSRPATAGASGGARRTEARRGGKEGGRTCRSRWSPEH